MPPNARINRAARIHPTYNAGNTMKTMLSPLRLNELLGFVHRSHPALPKHSMLSLSFNTSDASWRFNWVEHQLWTTA